MMSDALLSLLSAIVGGLLTGGASLYAGMKNRDAERNRLRKALFVEITGSEQRIDSLASHVESDNMPIQLSTNGLPSEVYQQNLGAIGRLSEAEVVSVLEFYQNLSGLKQAMKEHRKINEGKKDFAEQDVRESDMNAFWEFDIELRVTKLRRQQVAALHLLSDKR